MGEQEGRGAGGCVDGFEATRSAGDDDDDLEVEEGDNDGQLHRHHMD